MRERSVRNSICTIRKHFEDTLGGLVEDLDESDPAYKLKYQWARSTAAEAAMEHMPILDSRQGASEYIACVSWLVSHKLIDHAETKALLYAAQTALTGFAAKAAPFKPLNMKGKSNASKSK